MSSILMFLQNLGLPDVLAWIVIIVGGFILFSILFRILAIVIAMFIAVGGLLIGLWAVWRK